MKKQSLLLFNRKKDHGIFLFLIMVAVGSIAILSTENASAQTATIYVQDTSALTSSTNPSNLASFVGDLFFGEFTGLPAQATITDVGINVNVAAGNVRVKVYDDSGGVPHNLLAESDSTPVSGTGIQKIHLTTNAIVPNVGVVWAAYEVDSNTYSGVYHTTTSQSLYQVHTYGAGPSAASIKSDTHAMNILVYYYSSQVTLAPSTITTSAISNSQIRLNCSTSTGATWYKIDRESPKDAGFSTIVTNTTNSTTHYDDTGLTAGTQYNYRVWTGSSSGTSINASPSNATYTTQ